MTLSATSFFASTVPIRAHADSSTITIPSPCRASRTRPTKGLLRGLDYILMFTTINREGLFFSAVGCNDGDARAAGQSIEGTAGVLAVGGAVGAGKAGDPGRRPWPGQVAVGPG